MKKLIVNRIQALDLCELGFNEKCLHVFVGQKKKVKSWDFKFHCSVSELMRLNSMYLTNKEIIEDRERAYSSMYDDDGTVDYQGLNRLDSTIPYVTAPYNTQALKWLVKKLDIDFPSVAMNEKEESNLINKLIVDLMKKPVILPRKLKQTDCRKRE